jgi:hypothetical protein
MKRVGRLAATAFGKDDEANLCLLFKNSGISPLTWNMNLCLQWVRSWFHYFTNFGIQRIHQG